MTASGASGRSNPINSDTICKIGSELLQLGIVAMTNAIVICHNVDNALRYHRLGNYSIAEYMWSCPISLIS